MVVLGDRDELLRLAENLIENAIKYGAPSPVDVSVESREGQGSVFFFTLPIDPEPPSAFEPDAD